MLRQSTHPSRIPSSKVQSSQKNSPHIPANKEPGSPGWVSGSVQLQSLELQFTYTLGVSILPVTRGDDDDGDGD